MIEFSFPYTMADQKGSQRESRSDAQWAHPWRTDLAFRLSGPETISPSGGALQGGWYDGYHLQGNGSMGATYAALASR